MLVARLALGRGWLWTLWLRSAVHERALVEPGSDRTDERSRRLQEAAGAMIAQSVADILRHHVKLTVEGIDRMYLNVFVPRLQHETGIVGFFREHRGQPLPSAALMQPMSRAFVAKLESYAAQP